MPLSVVVTLLGMVGFTINDVQSLNAQDIDVTVSGITGATVIDVHPLTVADITLTLLGSIKSEISVSAGQ